MNSSPSMPTATSSTQAETPDAPPGLAAPTSFAPLQPYVTAVERRLTKLFPGSDGLSRRARQSLLGQGKRVRPCLALLWCEALRGDYRPALPIATAYELAHTAALVQDDILDRTMSRRGAPTLHAAAGVGRALLVANYLLFEIPRQLTAYRRTLPRARLHDLLELIARACHATTRGEYENLRLAQRKAVSEAAYLRMVRRKTGAFFGAPAACGAIVAGANPPLVRAAYAYGEQLGIAYQIMDDLSDALGDVAASPPNGKERRRGMENVVVAHAFREAPGPLRAQLVGGLTQVIFSPADVHALHHTFEALGSFRYAKRLARQIVGHLPGHLAQLPPGSARTILGHLGDWVAPRDDESVRLAVR
jgi:geranylgeranyl pyrophosphate synthase